MGGTGKHDYQRTARRASAREHPEAQRRAELWRAARGRKRERIAQWNADWNIAGRPTAFPDFDEWSRLNPPLY